MKSVVLSLIAAVALVTPTAASAFSNLKNQQASFTPPSDEELGRYVQQLRECYDVNSDQLFNDAEMIGLLKGTLYGLPCPIKRGSSSCDRSDLLTQEHLLQLEGFFGNKTFKLTRLYASEGDKCDPKQFHSAVDTKAPLITVLKTVNGKLLGGYSSTAWNPIDTYPQHEVLYTVDPNAFLFSLTHNKQVKGREDRADRNVHIRTTDSGSGLYGFGLYMLDIKSNLENAGVCQIFSDITLGIINYRSYYFEGILTQEEFTGTKDQMVNLSGLETFEVSFN